jgi:hypothetical protein
VRKETSIPRSSAEQGSQSQLFGKDDPNNASMKQKINQAGKGGWKARGPTGPSHRFRGFPKSFGKGYSNFLGGIHQIRNYSRHGASSGISGFAKGGYSPSHGSYNPSHGGFFKANGGQNFGKSKGSHKGQGALLDPGRSSCSFAFSTQAEIEDRVVEEEREGQRRGPSDPMRGVSLLVSPASFTFDGSVPKRLRSKSCPRNLARIFGDWCSHKGVDGGSEVSGPMVCDQKAERGRSEAETHLGLSKDQQLSEPVPFQTRSLAEYFPFLRKDMWACKVDLKHAYFHLGVGDELKPYLCVKVGDEVFQFQAACFGLSTLPQIWMNLMKVFQRKWRSKGLLVFIYLDDIFVVGDTQSATAKAI